MRDGQIGSHQEAEEFLRDFRGILSGAIVGALSDWDTVLRANPNETGGLSTSARARVIHDRTVHRLGVEEASGSYPGLRLAKIRGLYVVILNDTLMLKLKKLDLNLRSRNIRTGQTAAFDQQSALFPREVGVLTNATSGYVLDALGSELARVVVVCWDGRERRWEVDLLESAGEGGVVVTIPASPAPVRPIRTRIVPERPAASEQSDAE